MRVVVGKLWLIGGGTLFPVIGPQATGFLRVTPMSHNGRRTRRYSTNSVRSKSKSSRPSSPTLLRDTLRGRIASDRINSAAGLRDSLSSDEAGWAERRQRALSKEVTRPLYLQDLFVDSRGPRSDAMQEEGHTPRDPITSNTASFPSLEHDPTEDIRSSRKQSKPLVIRTTPSVLQQADSKDTILPTHEVYVEDPPSFQENFPTSLSIHKPFTYSSLPPTPITSSPPLVTTTYPVTPTKPQISYQQPFSIWDYLQEELLATDFDSHQEMKWERVSNFLNIPYAIEKVTERPPSPHFFGADLPTRLSVLGSSCALTPFFTPSLSFRYAQPWRFGVFWAISSLGGERHPCLQPRRPTYCACYC